MAAKVRLDHKGILDMLKSDDVRAEIDSYAERIHEIVANADEVTRNAAPTDVKHYTTDRAAAAVTIVHAAGLAIQAKYGTLTRAAKAVGLQVKARKK